MHLFGYYSLVSTLTAREHMDLAIWLITLKARWISGSAIEMCQFLGVKSVRS